VKTRVVAPSSMPEIYGQMLAPSQLRDLIAFLRRLDGSRGPDASEESFGTPIAPSSPYRRKAPPAATRKWGHS
jgi:hypothetical protein